MKIIKKIVGTFCYHTHTASRRYSHHAKFGQNQSNGCAKISQFNGFQNEGRPPSWILKSSKFSNGETVKGPILYQYAKFRRDRPSFAELIANFHIFLYRGRRHLGFAELRNFTWEEPICVILPRFVKITFTEIWLFNVFSRRRLSAIVDMLGTYLTTRHERLIVSINVQNLVKINE